MLLEVILTVLLFVSLQDRQLKVRDMVLSTHERAVRNCPWTMGLWKSYLLALERHGADHHTVSGNCDAVCDKHHLYGGLYFVTAGYERCKTTSLKSFPMRRIWTLFGLTSCLLCLPHRCFWEGAECRFHSSNRLRGDLAGLPRLPEETCGFQQRLEQPCVKQNLSLWLDINIYWISPVALLALVCPFLQSQVKS